MTKLTTTVLEYYCAVGAITIVWELGRWAVNSIVSMITSGDVDI